MSDRNATAWVTVAQIEDGQEALNILQNVLRFLPENAQGLSAEEQIALQTIEADIRRLTGPVAGPTIIAATVATPQYKKCGDYYCNDCYPQG